MEKGKWTGSIDSPFLSREGGASLSGSLAYAWSPFIQEARSCQTIISELLANPSWRDPLINPVFASPQDQRDRLALYSRVYDCLHPLQETLDGEQREAFDLVEYALIFLPEDPAVDPVDPATSADPALVRLREEVGLPPPPGRFYIRFYPSYAVMPGPVRDAFEKPDVVGVTFYTRYIAVLVQDPVRWNNNAGLDPATQDILSHELVHAYVASTLGFPDTYRQPVWYREGLAIYFSGSNRNVTYWSPTGSITHVPTQQYQEYSQNFEYLESRLGRADLEDLVRASIQRQDPGLLYRSLGLSDDDAFHLAVQGWVDARQRRRDLWTLAALLAAIVLIILLVAWWTGRGERADIATGDYLPPPEPGE